MLMQIVETILVMHHEVNLLFIGNNLVSFIEETIDNIVNFLFGD